MNITTGDDRLSLAEPPTGGILKPVSMNLRIQSNIIEV
jgi:hypothetical protein